MLGKLFFFGKKNEIHQGLTNLMFYLITWASAENTQKNDFKNALAGKHIIETLPSLYTPESIMAKSVVIFDDEQS